MALTLDAQKDNLIARIIELEREVEELKRTRPWAIIDAYVAGAVSSTGYLPLVIVVNGVETMYKVAVAT